MNPADSRSDLDRNSVDALDAAGAVIQTLDPNVTSVLQLDAFALDYAARRRVRPDRALAMLQTQMMDWTNSFDHRIERLSYDLSPEIPGKPQLKSHLTAPQVVFVCLPEGSTFYREGVREAAAVAYFPQSTYKFVSDRTGEIVELPSTKDRRGYSHVMAWYRSYTDAQDAADELRTALYDFARLDPSAEPEDDLQATVRRDTSRFDDIDIEDLISAQRCD